jgi:hypothetical protein
MLCWLRHHYLVLPPKAGLDAFDGLSRPILLAFPACHCIGPNLVVTDSNSLNASCFLNLPTPRERAAFCIDSKFFYLFFYVLFYIFFYVARISPCRFLTQTPRHCG